MQEPNSSEWQAPPPPERIDAAEGARMSEAATLGNIFFDPGETFEDLKRKPRFILATVIILLLLTAFNALFLQKIGYERLVRERIESNSRVQQLPSDQREQIIQSQSGPICKTIGYAAPPILFAIVIFV